MYCETQYFFSMCIARCNSSSSVFWEAELLLLCIAVLCCESLHFNSCNLQEAVLHSCVLREALLLLLSCTGGNNCLVVKTAEGSASAPVYRERQCSHSFLGREARGEHASCCDHGQMNKEDNSHAPLHTKVAKRQARDLKTTRGRLQSVHHSSRQSFRKDNFIFVSLDNSTTNL